jgi:hypothetical protein
MADDLFAPPPFKPAEALVQLKRQLRELRPLAERGSGLQLQGQDVVDLQADEQVIRARLAKRPARSPEWTNHVLRSSADVRRFVDEVKAQLRRWSDE